MVWAAWVEWIINRLETQQSPGKPGLFGILLIVKPFYLSEITTKDGLIHQGIFFQPQKHGTKALLWIHGLTGRFYGDVAMMEQAALMCEQNGWGLASFNNRGHDMITGAHRVDPVNHSGYSYATIGAGHEEFEESVYDMEAGVNFLVQQGFSEVILVGMSTGANKACYYGATTKDIHVAGIVLGGPMSDRYSSGYTSEIYKKYKAIMQKEIEEGRGDELKVGYDFFPLTPNRWMSLYVEGSAEDVFNYADEKNALAQFSKITKPLLVMIGENDEHADRPIEDIKKLFDDHARSNNYRSIILPNTNHGFDKKEKEAVDAIIEWVNTI